METLVEIILLIMMVITFLGAMSERDKDLQVNYIVFAFVLIIFEVALIKVA